MRRIDVSGHRPAPAHVQTDSNLRHSASTPATAPMPHLDVLAWLPEEPMIRRS